MQEVSMTLLQQLQSSLNKIYDGNTINTGAKEDGVPHKDMYTCQCGEVVPGEEWNEEYKMCRECYMELAEDHNVPPFEGINEYQSEGDR